jgi:hypothetical protein
MTTIVTDTTGAGSALGAPVSPIRESLDTTFPRLLATLRAAPTGSAPVKGMLWSVGELGAHIAQTVDVFTEAVNGKVTAYGERGDFSRAVDQRLVDELPERDPARLADLTEARYAEFRRAISDRPDDHVLQRIQNYTVAGINAVWVIDLNIHGYQLGEATGRPFAVDNEALRLALRTVLPFAANPVAMRGLHATFALHVRGTEAPIVYSIRDGALSVETERDTSTSVDCHIWIDPIAFLLVTLGVMPQWQAILSLKMRAWGRRPWLSAKTSKIFPRVPHGGVA